MSTESRTRSIFWHSPTMRCPHPLPLRAFLQPLHLPMLAASAWGCFSPSPSQTPAIKPCCNQEPEMSLSLALPQHGFPLKKYWVQYLLRERQTLQTNMCLMYSIGRRNHTCFQPFYELHLLNSSRSINRLAPCHL